jgi:phage gp36-like protein
MLPEPARAERAAAARNWLAGVALPAAIRAALTKLVEATVGDAATLGQSLASASSAVDGYLDPASRLELERLSRALEK